MADRKLELKRRGNRLLTRRSFEEAEEVFGKLVSEYPDAREGYVGLAKVLQRTDRYEATVNLLEPVAENLGSAQILRLLGDACRVLANRGKHEFVDRAISYYRSYHALRPDPVSLYYEADLLSKAKRDYEAALASYRASWDLDPRGRDAYMGVLNCLRQLDRLDELGEIKDLWKSRNS